MRHVRDKFASRFFETDFFCYIGSDNDDRVYTVMFFVPYRRHYKLDDVGKFYCYRTRFARFENVVYRVGKVLVFHDIRRTKADPYGVISRNFSVRRERRKSLRHILKQVVQLVLFNFKFSDRRFKRFRKIVQASRKISYLVLSAVRSANGIVALRHFLRKVSHLYQRP